MIRAITTTVCLLVLPILPSLAEAKPVDELASLRATIEGHNESFSRGFRQGDAEIIVRNYSPTARFLEPGAAPRVGLDAIRAYWRSTLPFIRDMILTTHSVEGTPEVLYETGFVDTWIELEDGKTIIQRDKYVNVWRRQADGSYKIAIDIWNRRPEPE